MLYSPILPPETMVPGTLGDIRPLADAHLVRTTAQSFAALRADLERGLGVVVVPDVLAGGLGRSLVSVSLQGVAPATTYAVHRRSDRRPLLREVLDVLVELGRQTRTGAPRPRSATGVPDAESPRPTGAAVPAEDRVGPESRGW